MRLGQVFLSVVSVFSLSASAFAQDVISHTAVYRSFETAPSNARAPRSAMPLISRSVLPLSTLMRGNSLSPSTKALAGAVAGSSDGVNPERAPAGKVTPFAYGDKYVYPVAPYTTARASAEHLGPTPTASAVGVTSYPWRVTGKLTFTIGQTLYSCSGSVIKPGLVLTAAHCVYEFGNNSTAGWHSNYLFTPAQYDLTAAPPYGTWTALQERIANTYYDGTDTCQAGSGRGIVCNNDIAIITMRPNAKGLLPGRVVGWYGYAYNGFSFTPSFGGATLASLTQLGYPIDFDSGKLLERTDGIGSYLLSGNLKNVILGTAQTGGASGGPWLVNFGAVPHLDLEANLGNASQPNLVVAVTSWGYTDPFINTDGASWFGQNKEFPAARYDDSHGVNRGAGNIGSIIARACSANPEAC